MGPITDEERNLIEKTAQGMTPENVNSVLLTLIERELSLLEGPLGDGDMRDITLHNVTVLIAAAAGLIIV